MRPIRFFITFIFFMLVSQFIEAQDKIYKLDGEVIECKVTEVAADQIKYTVSDFGPDVLIGIRKSEVDKIVFANGTEMVIDHVKEAQQTAERNSDQLFKIQKRNDIKVNFLSPLNGVLAFSFERSIKPGASWEATLGIVGIGFENPDDAFGVAMSGRYKFFKSPDFYLEGMRYAHILKGIYVAPELLFATYKGTAYSWWEDDVSYSRVKFALIINLGKQWVFNDIFLVDFYSGFGYGYTNDAGDNGWPYAFAVLKDVPLAFSYGLRIGFLFK